MRNIGEHIGQVIAIDNSEHYRAKMFGPRIRILVKDLNKLPGNIAVPRLDREGVVKYKVEYSGFPNQCGRCRSRDHQVRHCPRKEAKTPRRVQENQTTDNEDEPFPLVSNVQPSPTKESTQSQQEVIDTSGGEKHCREGGDSTTTGLRAPALRPNEARSTESPQNITQETITEATQQTPPLQTEEPEPPPPTEDSEPPPELQPTEENFPHLNSPGMGKRVLPQTPNSQQPGTPQAFIWRQKPPMTPNSGGEKGKEKLHMESAPITRQGYRSGRLSDDFWEVLNIPGTPTSPRKKLRVIPILTKNFVHSEYLADNSKQPSSSITIAHIAEVLAGVPWTLKRVKQHIVNETAQALHKVLIFNNQHNTPFQQWDQAFWFSQWDTVGDGEHICTLYASIAAPEAKIKIRKGRSIGWKSVPESIKAFLTTTSQAETILDVADLQDQWQTMTGKRNNINHPTPTVRNPFSVLSEEDEQSS